jgi:hypothetical protein
MGVRGDMDSINEKLIRDSLEVAEAWRQRCLKLESENNRLKMALALTAYSTPSISKSLKNRGRKSKFSDDDIMAFINHEEAFKLAYKQKGKKLTRDDYVWEILKNHFPTKNKYSLRGNTKTIINRMISLRKNS